MGSCSVDQFCEFVVQQECALWMLQLLLMLLNMTIMAIEVGSRGILNSESREGAEEVLGEDLSDCNAGVTQDLECE